MLECSLSLRSLFSVGSNVCFTVRKVKMGLDPPPGCSLSSLNPAMIKLESLHRHLTILNSTLHSGWVAVRKVRVVPHVPPNGTVTQKSLAYMRASTQYIKQVSKLLRNEVTISRTSPASDEAVQGMQTFSLLRVLYQVAEPLVMQLPFVESEVRLVTSFVVLNQDPSLKS